MLQEEVRDGAAWLTLDRPGRLNAFLGPDYRDLRVGLDRAAADPSVRVIVITGRGRAFSAGADRSLVDGTAGEAARQLAAEEFVGMLEAMDRCAKPLLAAVNGLAVGIGSTMLLHCDLVLMAESARLRFPFTSLGLVPEAGSSVLLPATARWPDALWAMLSSDWVDSAAAHAMGVAWRVVPDGTLVEEAAQAAGTLAALPPVAVAATKKLMIHGRAALVREAIEREFAAMSEMRDPGRSQQ